MGLDINHQPCLHKMDKCHVNENMCLIKNINMTKTQTLLNILRKCITLLLKKRLTWVSRMSHVAVTWIECTNIKYCHAK